MTHTLASDSAVRRGWAFIAQVIILLSLISIGSTPAVAATIRVSPDRNPVNVNESFNLVFSATEKPDDDPDFSPLEKDFKILSQGQSSQVSIVNGSFSRTTEWTLTLMPKEAGTFTIPAISFGSDRSQETTITVQAAAEESAAAGAAELLLEVQAEPRNPYVQAQVRYTVRVLRRVNFSSAELSEPAVQDALVERLGEDRGYQAERGGQQYVVIERQYAIFPQKSGPLRIAPLKLEAQIPGGGRSRFNSFFGQGTRVARVQSKTVELNVRPIPPAFKGRHWLPGESVELTESWPQSPPQAAVGEPITRTLSLRAKGATVGVLPELDPDLSRAVGDRAKLYPDQPALKEEKRPEGIISSRQEKTAILPGTPGTIVLPSVEIPWWNTRADRMEIAKLPERTLAVSGAAEAEAPVTATPVPQQGSAEIPPETGNTPEAVPAGNATSGAAADPWFWTSLAAFAGWLATALVWILGKRRPQDREEASQDERLPTLRAASRAVKEACNANDPVGARDALLAWAQARCPQDPPQNLAALAALSDGEMASEVRKLESALYGRSAAGWNGGALARLIAEKVHDAASSSAGKAGLEPLYRG